MVGSRESGKSEGDGKEKRGQGGKTEQEATLILGEEGTLYTSNASREKNKKGGRERRPFQLRWKEKAPGKEGIKRRVENCATTRILAKEKKNSPEIELEQQGGGERGEKVRGTMASTGKI